MVALPLFAGLSIVLIFLYRFFHNIDKAIFIYFLSIILAKNYGDFSPVSNYCTEEVITICFVISDFLFIKLPENMLYGDSVLKLLALPLHHLFWHCHGRCDK